MTPNLPKSRAFTLVEIMVVVALIAVVSAVILANMGGTLQDALLRSSTRQIVSVFTAAYSSAVSAGSARRVLFDAPTGRYVIESRKGRDFAPLEGVPDGAGQIDPRIRLEVQPRGDQPPEPGSITFYADGTADNCQVELRDRQGFARVVRVDPITARLDVFEPKN